MTRSGPHGSLTVLVADDDADLRDVIAWMLEEAGHVALTARDGQDALRTLRERGPVDLLLSDVNMPEMDGVALSRAVDTTYPGLPMLLISGRAAPDTGRPFLPKPFRWETLSDAISQAARTCGPC